MSKIIVGLVLLLCSGCVRVTGPEIKKSEGLCSDRGGLHVITGSGIHRRAHCNDLSVVNLYE